MLFHVSNNNIQLYERGSERWLLVALHHHLQILKETWQQPVHKMCRRRCESTSKRRRVYSRAFGERGVGSSRVVG